MKSDNYQNIALLRKGPQLDEVIYLIDGLIPCSYIGEISICIMESNDDLIDKMEKLVERLEFYNAKKNWEQIAIMIRHAIDYFQLGVLGNLLVFLPACTVYATKMEEFERQYAHEQECKERMESIRQGIKPQDIDDSIEDGHPASMVDADVWFGFVYHKNKEFLRPNYAKSIELFTELYITAFHQEIREVKRLRRRLPKAVITRDPMVISELRDLRFGMRMQDKVSSDQIFGIDIGDKYGQAYITTNLCSIVAAELDLLSRMDRDIMKCTICGQWFVPRKHGSKYCNRINPKTGRSCAQTGTSRDYARRRRQDTLDGTYKKCIDTYYQWLRRNVDENAKKNMVSFICDYLQFHDDLTEEESHMKAEETWESINSEIISTNDSWRTTVDNTRNQYNQGLLSAEAYIEKLKCPSVKERSPLLNLWKRKIRSVSSSTPDSE